jgi:multisubunit Na+/H+ antiporter MnhB subunit
MEKLFKALGKMLESVLTSKTALLMLIVVAILSLAILALAETPVGTFFGLDNFVKCEDDMLICPRAVVGLLGFISIILILVRIVVSIIGKIREKYFV